MAMAKSKQNRTACRVVDGRRMCRLYEAGGCDFFICKADVNRRCHHCEPSRACGLEAAWPGGDVVEMVKPDKLNQKRRRKVVKPPADVEVEAVKPPDPQQIVPERRAKRKTRPVKRRLSGAKRERFLDDMRKLNGDPPHNDMSNICWGDGYFAKSLEKKYQMSGQQLQKMYQELTQ